LPGAANAIMPENLVSLFSRTSWLGRSNGLPAPWADALRAIRPWSGLERSAFRVFAYRTTPHTAVRGFEILAGPETGSRCWLKVYRRTPDDAGHEFAFLQAADARLSGCNGPSAARALAWLPGIGGVVTAHLDGPTLATLLADPSVSAARKAQQCRDAGTLLARLHAPGAGDDPASFDWGGVLAALRRELEDFPASSRQAWNAQLERLAVHGAGGEQGLRLAHGDFAPFNLIVTSTGLAVFDPSFHRAWPRPGNRSAPAEDLARFAATLLGVTSITLDDPVRRQLAGEFFAAYHAAGGAALSLRSPACRVLLTYFLLRGLRDWGGWRLRLRGGPARAPVLHRWLDELATDSP